MTSTQTPKISKRPRLSLQINTATDPPLKGSRDQFVDPSDATAFNTMSNIYVSAMERFSALPLPSEPMTAINTLQDLSLQTPVDKANSRPRVVTPFVPTYPVTPSTVQPISPQQLDLVYPSTKSATPPSSAEALDNTSKVFTFSLADTSSSSSSSSSSPLPSCPSIRSPTGGRLSSRRGPTSCASEPLSRMPYTHPRSLHSILRNSPLTPRPAIPPPSPRRQPLCPRKQAAKKVEYDSPLEEEITTFKYTKSHIDLLAEDGSPLSPSDALSVAGSELMLDMALSFTDNEIRDGGQTPGPFEDMRCRMAGLAAAASPISPNANTWANRKRKRREKKRQWVWTIGQEEDDDEEVGGSIAALQAPAQTANKTMSPQQHSLAMAAECQDLPTLSIGSSSSLTDSSDEEMSDSCSIVSSEGDQRRRCLSVPSPGAEAGVKTPTGVKGD
ncbi:hypothetical protein E4U41_001383 [Claviceps citrina]|nr:hypothetical protein E4U41_001383 [Claviceps citrina]